MYPGLGMGTYIQTDTATAAACIELETDTVSVVSDHLGEQRSVHVRGFKADDQHLSNRVCHDLDIPLLIIQIQI